MAECARISANIELDCDNPIQAGVKDRMVLINWDDYDAAVKTVDVSNSQIIESITFATTATGYLVEGQNNSNETKETLIKGRYAKSFEHQVVFKVFNKDADVKQQLERLSKGRVVAIVENNFTGVDGNASFDIFGHGSGLIMEALERDASNQDTQGAYDITLKTSEFSREAHLSATLFDTDYTTTKAVFDGLYIP